VSAREYEIPRAIDAPCPACGGLGRLADAPCGDCEGTGRREVTATITVRVSGRWLRGCYSGPPEACYEGESPAAWCVAVTTDAGPLPLSALSDAALEALCEEALDLNLAAEEDRP